MGTRNLTCVVKGGKFKVAQYGQWDGYPSGNGVEILAWLSDPKADFTRLSAAVDNVMQVEGNEEDQTWVEVGKDDGLVIPVADFDKYPSFTRDMGAGVLEYVVSTENPVVVLEDSFANDSLFCEWAYVVDLDKMTLDVYEGFNREPVPEGELFYTGETPEKPDYEGAEAYYPVALAKSYDLNNLPSQEEFLADLEPEENDE